MPTVTIRHSTVTEPQRKFWEDANPFLAFIGGVGSGKTRIGVLKSFSMTVSVGVVVAPTYPMLRDSTLRTFQEMARAAKVLAQWKESDYLAKLTNGTEILFRSADQPDRLRGPNIGWFWLDEAAMMNVDVWNIMLGRLREKPGKAWITTTPRGGNWIYDRWVRNPLPGYSMVRSSSKDNPFLPADFVANLESAYTNRFARQEIGGEFLLDVPGALWSTKGIDDSRVPHPPADMIRIVVGVDPKASVEADSKTGIVVVGKGADGHLYTLEDASIDASPDQWARKVAYVYDKWQADCVVAEVNQGGDMVTSVLRTVSPNLPIRTVRAAKGKYTRAEPVAALWEQGRAHMVGSWPTLEEQMCTYTTGDDSPDNMDALVWACTNLMTQAAPSIVDNPFYL